MHVFVYGTLRKEFQNPVAKFLRKHSKFIGKGTAPGHLYDLGSFPGAVFNAHTSEVIHGEIYFIQKNTEAVLAALDRYEGIDDPNFDYYEKTEALIKVNNTSIKASVYNFKKSTVSFKKIESGDYSSYLGNP
ncbi:gamma-glutamylcyclotransferase [Galbibacter sp. BG1]|uniref:gamma-glutamylcyclotransferase family protein n=1 Tax=Galbibacter sp. BG1 TaxID=1170699 RepID=UPI0015BD18FE|nr:gamma-glutamylcyclotransferase family protein [Galbibacter sp. BG1]QLE00237.1 gamma-glutamylcyclotransferase [Galbibacter sp. BG1]